MPLFAKKSSHPPACGDDHGDSRRLSSSSNPGSSPRSILRPVDPPDRLPPPPPLYTAGDTRNSAFAISSPRQVSAGRDRFASLPPSSPLCSSDMPTPRVSHPADRERRESLPVPLSLSQLDIYIPHPRIYTESDRLARACGQDPLSSSVSSPSFTGWHRQPEHSEPDRGGHNRYNPAYPKSRHASITFTHPDQPPERGAPRLPRGSPLYMERRRSSLPPPPPFPTPDPRHVLKSLGRALRKEGQRLRDYIEVEELLEGKLSDTQEQQGLKEYGRDKEVKAKNPFKIAEEERKKREQENHVFGANIQDIAGSAMTTTIFGGYAHDLPVVVVACVEELYRTGIYQPNLFRALPNRPRLLHLVARFDAFSFHSSEPGMRIPSLRQESMPDICALLSTYLSALPSSLLHRCFFDALWAWSVNPTLIREAERRNLRLRAEKEADASDNEGDRNPHSSESESESEEEDGLGGLPSFHSRRRKLRRRERERERAKRRAVSDSSGSHTHRRRSRSRSRSRHVTHSQHTGDSSASAGTHGLDVDPRCSQLARELHALETPQIDIARHVLLLLPPLSFSLLTYLLSFFSQLPLCPDNGIGYEDIARIFAFRLLGGPSKGTARITMVWLLSRWSRILEGFEGDGVQEGESAHRKMGLVLSPGRVDDGAGGAFPGCGRKRSSSVVVSPSSQGLGDEKRRRASVAEGPQQRYSGAGRKSFVSEQQRRLGHGRLPPSLSGSRDGMGSTMQGSLGSVPNEEDKEASETSSQHSWEILDVTPESGTTSTVNTVSNDEDKRLADDEESVYSDNEDPPFQAQPVAPSRDTDKCRQHTSPQHTFKTTVSSSGPSLLPVYSGQISSEFKYDVEAAGRFVAEREHAELKRQLETALSERDEARRVVTEMQRVVGGMTKGL